MTITLLSKTGSRSSHFALSLAAIACGALLFTSCSSGTTSVDAEKAQQVLDSEETVGKDMPGERAGIRGEEVSYKADSVVMKGYIAYPMDGKQHPGVIIVHEWWGHNDYVRSRADQLAELGYVALAVDMYGDGKQAKHPDTAGKFAGMVMSNIDLAEARFDAAMEVLAANTASDPEHVAAVGYCFGGSVVLTMADMGKDLDAVAAFHSGVELPVMPTTDLKARVLVANGAEDPFISEESVTAFTHQLDSVGARYEYLSLEGAKHAYTNKDATEMGKKFELPLEYNAEADARAWEELKKLLSETMGG